MVWSLDTSGKLNRPLERNCHLVATGDGIPSVFELRTAQINTYITTFIRGSLLRSQAEHFTRNRGDRRACKKKKRRNKLQPRWEERRSTKRKIKQVKQIKLIKIRARLTKFSQSRLTKLQVYYILV